MSSAIDASTNRVISVAELEALVGMHVIGEVPEIFWEDSHGHFQFGTEDEARAAVGDPYYQQFLPAVDWSQTVIRRVQIYKPYCSDAATVWQVVSKASDRHGPVSLGCNQGRWWSAFGSNARKEARTAPVAICLAALEAEGIRFELDHDRVDSELSRKDGLAGTPAGPENETLL